MKKQVVIRPMGPADVEAVSSISRESIKTVNEYLHRDDYFAIVASIDLCLAGATLAMCDQNTITLFLTAIAAPTPKAFDGIFRQLIEAVKAQMDGRDCDNILSYSTFRGDDVDWPKLFHRAGFLSTKIVTDGDETYHSLVYSRGPCHAGACVIESIMDDDARVVRGIG